MVTLEKQMISFSFRVFDPDDWMPILRSVFEGLMVSLIVITTLLAACFVHIGKFAFQLMSLSKLHTLIIHKHFISFSWFSVLFYNFITFNIRVYRFRNFITCLIFSILHLSLTSHSFHVLFCLCCFSWLSTCVAWIWVNKAWFLIRHGNYLTVNESVLINYFWLSL